MAFNKECTISYQKKTSLGSERCEPTLNVKDLVY